MTAYKEPFGKAWVKLLKTELFPNVLKNAQPISININVGKGWDWLSVVPVEGTIIKIEITENEIIQCNYDDNHFICFVNFGNGYKFLHIPFSSIYSIEIGSIHNWIQNPIDAIPFDLKEDTINYLNENEEKNNLENGGLIDGKMERSN